MYFRLGKESSLSSYKRQKLVCEVYVLCQLIVRRDGYKKIRGMVINGPLHSVSVQACARVTRWRLVAYLLVLSEHLTFQ